ncbi:MAG: trypsin-like peptidase domain-containing protein [Clostridia bacterium]|nr:trypsin-like peptidase domain-containing protein [Clostridia bacterium]
MYKKKWLIKRILVFCVAIAITLSCVACNSDYDKYYIIWMDTDGTLLECTVVDSDFDPSLRDLPADNEQWQYTDWNVIKSGNKIECTALRLKKSKIQWIDADGIILKEENIVIADSTEPSYPLPQDSENWHYTEWIKSVTSDGVRYNAKRVPKEKYIWKDTDGTVLKEVSIVQGQEIPTLDLPANDEKWRYIQWDFVIENEVHVYTAERTPNSSYFEGNVFQIVVKDVEGTPLGTGSGFIINEDGWFITNNHVMEGASSAIAFFDIKDQSSGSRYTQLNILGGIFHSSEKDIFIGKLDGYEKIQSHYKNIKFTEEYVIGEKSYTVGYPNSSVQMEINAGVLLEEYSDIYDKINGIYYILSDSYIAPGSSGGILINENFKVIGITTIGLYADDNKQIYTAGGSVPTFVFSTYLSNLDLTKIQKLTDIYNKGE